MPADTNEPPESKGARSSGARKDPPGKRPGGSQGARPAGPRSGKPGGAKPWQKRSGGGGGTGGGAKFGDRKPFVRRDDAGGGGAPRGDGERKPWVKREGGGGSGARFGERKPFVRRDDAGGSGPPRGDGERKPYVKREGGGGSAARFGDRKPFVRRDDAGGGGAPRGAGERKPYVKREGGGGSGAPFGERKPFVRRDDAGGSGPPRGDGERKPYFKREGGGGSGAPFGERKPFVRRDDAGGSGAPRGDGERKPFVKREGGGGSGARFGERKPFVRRDDAGSSGPPRGDGERKPYVKREGGGAPGRDGERKPYVKREGGGGSGARFGERKPFVRRDDASGSGPPRGDGERKPYVKREGGGGSAARFGERKPFVRRDDAGGSGAPRGDGERKPYVKREGGGDGKSRFIDRKPLKPRDDGDGNSGPKSPRSDGERKPWVKRDGGGANTFADRKSSNPKQRPDRRKPAEPTRGLDAREEAVELIEWVISKKRALDDALARSAHTPGLRKLKPNDRAFARMMAATALRRHGQIAAVFADFMANPLDAASGHTTAILHAAATQLLFLQTPSHAAVNIAVEQAQLNPSSQRYEKMVNALLRRVVTEGPEIIAGQDPIALNIPAWMMARWTATYGEETARKIAVASLAEAPLDLSVKSDPERWAAELGGEVLPTGTVRLPGGGRVDQMPGFEEGAWWVQDAAAALPVRLLGDVRGMRIADICAAPGGKTMELAARGAIVTSVDISKERLDRVRQNLARTKLTAECVVADVTTWAAPEAFDAVLLDVPCTATGTIRRHPDILHIKRETDLAQLADIQAGLLRAASRLVKPGGLLVYCACSLEPQEGVEQVGRFLATATNVEVVPVTADEIGGWIECITPRGYLQTLPCHLDRGNPAQSGLDGFFAARLRMKA